MKINYLFPILGVGTASAVLASIFCGNQEKSTSTESKPKKDEKDKEDEELPSLKDFLDSIDNDDDDTENYSDMSNFDDEIREMISAEVEVAVAEAMECVNTLAEAIEEIVKYDKESDKIVTMHTESIEELSKTLPLIKEMKEEVKEMRKAVNEKIDAAPTIVVSADAVPSGEDVNLLEEINKRLAEVDKHLHEVEGSTRGLVLECNETSKITETHTERIESIVTSLDAITKWITEMDAYLDDIYEDEEENDENSPENEEFEYVEDGASSKNIEEKGGNKTTE